MIQPISSNFTLAPIAPLSPIDGAGVGGAAKGKDFRGVLMDNLGEVNRLQQEADQGVQQLLAGETDDVTGVLTAVNKAGIAFDLLMEVRNKLVGAYEEIQQMRV